jgi:high-affinity iron transporter
MIFVMALAMLKMDRAQAKWRYKLQLAFEKQQAKHDRSGMASKYALFILPLITVLREGLEAVVFVGGVALGQSATAIPLAAIIGILCGLIVGFIIYFSSRKINLSAFLIVSTTLLLFIGAGLFSKTVQFFDAYKFNQLAGGDAGESGNGPGSFDVRGMVVSFTYGMSISLF